MHMAPRPPRLVVWVVYWTSAWSKRHPYPIEAAGKAMSTWRKQCLFLICPKAPVDLCDPRFNQRSKCKWSHSVVSTSLWPHGLQPTRLLYPWDFPGKSTGVGCHFLLHRIFPTQGSNPGLPHCRQTFYHLSHQGRRIAFYLKEAARVWAVLETWSAHEMGSRPPKMAVGEEDGRSQTSHPSYIYSLAWSHPHR